MTHTRDSYDQPSGSKAQPALKRSFGILCSIDIIYERLRKKCLNEVSLIASIIYVFFFSPKYLSSFTDVASWTTQLAVQTRKLADMTNGPIAGQLPRTFSYFSTIFYLKSYEING